MNSKRINITMPEEDLEKINKFCAEEKMNKSQLIRESTKQYIASIRELKEKEQRRKNIEWAIKMQDKIRQKSKSFPSGKSAVEIIREYRDSR
ncbi:MAG: ribbon-helix-helix protein, CopG family [Actinobacteria bacterium]|nr:ribbon-helix-helix protein, CopG family [Actinomycetota bacterium]